MPSWFTTKKVEGSLMLAEKLKEIRAAQNISLDRLSDETKISKKYLLYLEDSRLDKLPAEIYVKGFLKKLAEFYKVDAKIFLRLYEKEDVIHKNIAKSKYPPFNLNKSPTFIITPRIITTAIAAIVAFFFLAFIFYQLSFALNGSELIIDSPEDGLVTSQAQILINGTIKDPDAAVSINNEVINLKDGKISELLNLSPGLNIIKISATNKFKITNTVIRKVILKSGN